MAEKFTSPLFVRCPPSMTDLIEKVAESQFTTVSEYVRGAVVDRLKTDGHFAQGGVPDYGQSPTLRSRDFSARKVTDASR